MKEKNYELAQRGNPHSLTIKQHIFPKSCIARFANSRELVQVRRHHEQRVCEIKPGDELFCAFRAWDHRAETAISHPIEGAYASLADRIAAGNAKELDADENELVTHFYELCRNRFNAHCNPHPDIQIRGVMPDTNLDKDKQEILEKIGCTFVRPDGKMPGRMVTGLKMMMQPIYSKRLQRFPRWGIWRATEGEFVVADNFMMVRCLPLTPTIVLSADASNYNLGFGEVAEFNAYHIRQSREYYFARDISACPVYRRTLPTRNFNVQWS